MSIQTVDQKAATQAKVTQSAQTTSSRNGTPPLQPGDYLTRAEFERRYHAHATFVQRLARES